MKQFHPEQNCCSYLRVESQSCRLVITSVQKQTTFIDSHAVEEGPEIVSSALDLEDPYSYWEESILRKFTAASHVQVQNSTVL